MNYGEIIVNHNKIVIEYESEIYWCYAENEKDLLLHTSDIKKLSNWIEMNLQDNSIGAFQE